VTINQPALDVATARATYCGTGCCREGTRDQVAAAKSAPTASHATAGQTRKPIDSLRWDLNAAALGDPATAMATPPKGYSSIKKRLTVKRLLMCYGPRGGGCTG